MHQMFDVSVIGGGITGLAAALMYAKNGMTVCVIDTIYANKKEESERYFSLSVSAKKILSNIDVWQDLQRTDFGVANSIDVWEEADKSILKFDLPDRLRPPMAWIVSERQLFRILKENILRNEIPVFCSNVSCERDSEYAPVLSLQDDTSLKTKLVVVADGRNSRTRSMLGIKFFNKNFNQSAIVANVVTETSHDKIARQCFLKKGPLAFLPLKDNFHCSVVWSVPSSDATRLLGLDQQGFNKELAEAFDFKLGAIYSSSSLMSFPLEYGIASRLTKNRFALVGSAAHAFHPLAGQGLNLALLDIATLIQCTTSDLRVNATRLDSSLKRYHGWRKSEALKMIAMTTGLNSIYRQHNFPAPLLRRLGLRFLNSRKFWKDCLIESAMGLRGDMPDIVKLDEPS